MIVPAGIRQVSWYLDIPAGTILNLVVSVLGYWVQFWCLQFSKHLLELGRFKPRKTIERTAEPQAIQFNGAAEHLPDHEVHITVANKTNNDQRSLEAEIRQINVRSEMCFITKTFSKNSLLTFIVQARSRVAQHNITP